MVFVFAYDDMSINFANINTNPLINIMYLSIYPKVYRIKWYLLWSDFINIYGQRFQQQNEQLPLT